MLKWNPETKKQKPKKELSFISRFINGTITEKQLKLVLKNLA